MQSIQPEFEKRSRLPVKIQGKSSDSESESDAETGTEGMDALTLEMSDNPFSSLINKIERLMDTGMQEDMAAALDLVSKALREGIYTDKMESKLQDKLGQIIDHLHNGNELGKTFTASALAVPAFVYTRPANDDGLTQGAPKFGMGGP